MFVLFVIKFGDSFIILVVFVMNVIMFVVMVVVGVVFGENFRFVEIIVGVLFIVVGVMFCILLLFNFL